MPYTWLKLHNPWIDWASNLLRMKQGPRTKIIRGIQGTDKDPDVKQINAITIFGRNLHKALKQGAQTFVACVRIDRGASERTINGIEEDPMGISIMHKDGLRI